MEKSSREQGFLLTLGRRIQRHGDGVPGEPPDRPEGPPAASRSMMEALVAAWLATTRTVAGMSSHSTGKTRAQVRAELAAAKTAGEVSFGDLDYPPEGH
ncbi:MAG TPA: DUF4148 domain-containing protein [Bordetella sp.]|nr:DUF4148 domain-containing protein [Bordetella sp.]